MACIQLAHLVEPADAGVGRIVSREGELGAIESLRERSPLFAVRLGAFNPDEAEERAQRLGMRIIVRDESEWPRQLDDLGDTRPFALWVQGAANLRLSCVRSVAIVGARAATPYGLSVARDWSAELASEHISVVSGAAFGIDAAAHRGALSVDGLTIAVLASGADVVYPRAHEQLIARIADEGLVISESPLGEPARRQRFLTRNRVIAALTQATVVVEAALRSGTTATANAAARLNRHVLVVPGPVTSMMSAGCHHLVREGGAVLAGGAADVLECLLPAEQALALSTRRLRKTRDSVSIPADALNQDQSRIRDLLPSSGSISVDELCLASGLSIASLLTALGTLSSLGFAEAESGGWARRA
ncbi:MAG: DNA-processing protein DprA [Candidatus Nanopelagicales bacterium]